MSGGDNVGTGYNSGASSPKNKVKFLCSHGGKILPRPTDGQLKYVGGETRVIAVPRDITCSELMQKVTTLIDCHMVLKYQPFHEDLDALVSVRSDEDLKHMLNECDRYEGEGAPMLRVFLFQSRPLVLENQAAILETPSLEQRYIDAINGIIRTSSMPRLNPIRVSSTSSTCSSPKSNSPEGHTIENAGHESFSFNGSCNRPIRMMHKVRSYPNINSLSSQQSHNSSGLDSPNSQQYDYGYLHQNYHHHHQYYPPRKGYLLISPSPPPDPLVRIGMERLPSPYSAETGSPYSPTTRLNKGVGGSIKGRCHDEYGQFRFERGLLFQGVPDIYIMGSRIKGGVCVGELSIWQPHCYSGFSMKVIIWR